MLDLCSVGGQGGSLFGGGSAYSISCERSDTRYYVYTGQARMRLGQLERVLGRAGWGGFTTVAGGGAAGPLPMIRADPVKVGGPPVGKVGLELSWGSAMR